PLTSDSMRMVRDAAALGKMFSRGRPRRPPDRGLEVAALRLFALDRLEERLEIADAEATRPVPLDDLEEERGAVLNRAGEDLEEVPLPVAVGLDAELLEHVHRHADVADALGQRRVVLMRHAQELDS